MDELLTGYTSEQLLSELSRAITGIPTAGFRLRARA